jgi:hypothetical protein
LHVGEAAHPEELIGLVEHAKLSDDSHAEVFLRFDELAIEEVDQDVPSTWTKRILSELYNRAGHAGSPYDSDWRCSGVLDLRMI